MFLSARILATWLSMKLWPPNPGLTLMMSTRSTTSSTCSMADRLVAGLSTTPLLQPRSLICRGGVGVDGGGWWV